MLSETNFTHVPLVIDIVFRCFGVYLSFNKKPTAELGKRNLWMTTIAEEGNPGYGWFCFPVLSDWQRNLYYGKKIKFKTEISHALVTCIFPRFQLFGCFYFEFSLATCDIFLRSDWP